MRDAWLPLPVVQRQPALRWLVPVLAAATVAVVATPLSDSGSPATGLPDTTVAALINQGGIVIPLQISNALTSGVGLHSAALASTLALGMIVIVTSVMVAYSRLQNRTAKWLQ